jgi:hypothetical protein
MTDFSEGYNVLIKNGELTLEPLKVQVCEICECFDRELPILQKGEICVKCALLLSKKNTEERFWYRKR